MSASLTYALLLLNLLVATKWSQTIAQDPPFRVTTDYDESSCICGLNSKILDQLELIVRESVSSCSAKPSKDNASVDLDPKASHLRPMEVIENTPIKEEITQPEARPTEAPKIEKPTPEPIFVEKKPEQQVPTTANSETANSKDNNNGNSASMSNSPGGSSSSTSHTISSIETLTMEIQKLEHQIQKLQQETSSSETSSSSEPPKVQENQIEKPQETSKHQNKPEEPSINHGKPTEPSVQQQDKLNESSKHHNKQPQVVDTGFLNGIVDGGSPNEALMKLNQSKQIDPHELESALQSTVPNVVSNIFSNIQNLTNGNELPNTPNAAGSMVQGNTKDEITASGEEIFLAWIEHQLETLHLTASTANYIRKSAFGLFKKIVKQYVDRMAKMSDSLEDNMRKATQLALNNTQNLIGFILKNYINFAGGLMQIIGEQVSRVGKQLDATGDTIAHTSLNPLDIVANVIESLPNPSDYSKYFRAFGKQLIGQFTNQQEEPDQSNAQGGNQNGNNNEPHRPSGFITKTMGALTKTLGSWLG